MPDTEAPAIQRPVAITIIAWVSIGFGIFFALIYALAAFVYLSNAGDQVATDVSPTAFLGWSIPPAAYWTLVLAVPVVLIIDSIFLLRGHNWARMLATIWWAFCLLSLIYTYGLNVLTGIQAAVCLLVIFFLNTNRAIAYFNQRGARSI